ncbi:MAG TPA: hypothetical protein VKK81_22895, partial [Candidatus Binatia bacterium]|nr:hypothetical protein [Candidatus Binatia bacterium]
EQMEAQCEGLIRRGQFLCASGTETVPDGTLTGCYSFLHALYQSVVYERVGASQRVRLHRRIGERLEAAYGPRAGEIAAELAVHFEQGRDYQRAVQYHQQAAANATKRSANAETIAHLTRGLELLRALPDTRERAQLELSLQLALGAPLIATKGYAAQETGQAYTRARELCQQLGDTPQFFPVLFGLTAFHVVRGEFRTARELSEQLLRLAQSVQDPALLVPARHALGQTLYYLGELVSAREHLEQGIAVYDPQKHHSLALLYGTDPGVHCLVFMAFVLWSLGYPDRALKRAHEALILARRFSYPFSLVLALIGMTGVHLFRREAQATQEWAEATIALCTEQGFASLLALGTIFQGWALTEQGQRKERIAQIRSGLADHRASGGVMRSSYFALLAEAYGKTGQPEEGLSVLTEALALVQKTEEHRWDAELYRLKGQLTLQTVQVSGSKLQGQPKQKAKGKIRRSPLPNTQQLISSTSSEAEAYFLKALEIARRQQAKSLELRAAMSLSRLWQQQGKKIEARQLLAKVYNWFTEGFDMKDLQEAKALLEQLS